MNMKTKMFSNFPLGKKVVWITILILSIALVSADSIFLSDYMEEGQTKVYETEDGSYVINLLAVSDNKEKAVFRLNNEMSKGVKIRDSYVFKDGSEVVVRELILSDAGERKDEAYYYFYGTGKGVLPLKNVSLYVIDNNLCNFDTQCLNETKANCCYDCGCPEEKECINNECVEIKEEEVEIEEEEEKEEIEEKEETAEEEVKIEDKKETYLLS